MLRYIRGSPYVRRCLLVSARLMPYDPSRTIRFDGTPDHLHWKGLTMRSDQIKKGFERAPHRALLRSTGVIRSEADFDKPFVAIANSYTDIVPGHVHLQEVGRIVKEAVRAAGGVPFEFNTIAVDDGIVMGHFGMKYSLPSRELIADCVETMVAAHCFDAMVCIPNCDKIVPGMLMAAMRLDIPTIFVSGGPMRAGTLPDGRARRPDQRLRGRGRLQRRPHRRAASCASWRLSACPGCGSCAGMFTANSMNCLTEAIGLSLPGNGTILADSEERKELYRQSAHQIMKLLEANLTPRQHRHAAVARQRLRPGHGDGRLDEHRPARARPGPRRRRRLPARSASTRWRRACPYICKVAPANDVHVEDVDRAGGVSAILNEISRKPGVLDLDRDRPSR